MFHLVSAFEAFINNNFPSKKTVNRSGIYFQGLDAFQVIEVDDDFILVRLAMLANLSQDKIDQLEIDSLFNIFGWDAWIVFHESPCELDPVIYCCDDANAYSLESCLEVGVEEETSQEEDRRLEKAELEHAMSEAYEKGWAL